MLANDKKKTILICSANPIDMPRDRLEYEQRLIERTLRRDKQRDEYQIVYSTATTIKTLRQALLDTEPTILHFCGTANHRGLLVEDQDGIAKSVDPRDFLNLLELFKDTLKLVFLSGCYHPDLMKNVKTQISDVAGILPHPDLNRRELENLVAAFYEAVFNGRETTWAVDYARKSQKLDIDREHIANLLVSGSSTFFYEQSKMTTETSKLRRKSKDEITDTLNYRLHINQNLGKSSPQTVNELFRHIPQENLTEKLAIQMIFNFNFFDSDWHSEGAGFANAYSYSDKIIEDNASKLIWQQSGSPEQYSYSGIADYIHTLNKDQYAGYANWRIPTLEEAMSLLNAKKNNAGLFINSKFDIRQNWIWTADLLNEEEAWFVFFDFGDCGRGNLEEKAYVRAVCSASENNESRK